MAPLLAANLLPHTTTTHTIFSSGGCGLQAGSFRVMRSYPNFWTYYLKLLAHGYTHENAKWQAREAFELRREEKNSGKVPEKARGAGRSPEGTTDVGANQQKKKTNCG